MVNENHFYLNLKDITDITQKPNAVTKSSPTSIGVSPLDDYKTVNSERPLKRYREDKHNQLSNVDVKPLSPKANYKVAGFENMPDAKKSKFASQFSDTPKRHFLAKSWMTDPADIGPKLNIMKKFFVRGYIF